MENSKKPSPLNNFRIGIENFGPIAKANVEMRPLTVFIGPSNVGKSYLAILIYAFYQCFCNSSNHLHSFKTIWLREFTSRSDHFKEFSDDPSRLNLLNEWLNTYDDRNVQPLPNIISSIIQRAIEQPRSTDHQFIKEQIERCFGVDSTDELIRRRSARSNVALEFNPNVHFASNSLRWDIELNKSNPSHDNFPISSRFKVSHLNEISKVLTDSELIRKNEHFPFFKFRDIHTNKINFDKDTAEQILAEISQTVVESFLRPIYKTAYYLPANRTGIMSAHQVVVSALVQNASRAGIQPTASAPSLTGITGDYLDQLVHLSSYKKRSKQKNRRESQILSGSIEENIMRGEVNLNQVNEFCSPDFSYRPDGWKKDLPFTRVSSMVSELAPIVLYLRYLVVPGDVLIIEEPEAHLHPAMQAKLAEELIKLVKIGVRIIVTTHSEWFLEKIGNLTRLPKVPEENLSAEEKEVSLEEKYFGAWLFHEPDNCDGSLVEEICVDYETGLFPDQYSAVSESLYNEGANIYNRLPQEYRSE